MKKQTSRLLITAATLTLSLVGGTMLGQAATATANTTTQSSGVSVSSQVMSTGTADVSQKSTNSSTQRTATNTKTTKAVTTQQVLKLSGIKVTARAVTGHAVSGATIQLINANRVVVATTTANGQGNFSLAGTNLTSGPLTVKATKAGYQAASWQYVATLKLSRVKVAKKTVTGHTVAGARVQLRNAKKQTIATATAGTNGNFTLNTSQTVSNQPLTLSASKRGYHATTWKYTAPLKLTKVKVTKKAVTGHTTAGASVKVVNLSKQTLGHAKANGKGNFTVKTRKTVNTAPFNLIASKAQYRTATWKYTAALKLTKVKVAGKTITGHAVAGATVKLLNTKNQILGQAKANRKGNFTIRTKHSQTTSTFTLLANKTRYHKARWHYTAKKLNVPLIAQRPELPTGCEITAVTMMLRYKGCKVTKLSLTNEMPRSSSPYSGFVGNPYTSSGWTIYPSALMKLVRKHAHSAVNLTGVSVTRLEKQINKKHPVTLWVTGVDGFNTHALTMTGYNPSRIYYNDPWTNRKTSMTISSFKKHWRQDGYRALSY